MGSLGRQYWARYGSASLVGKRAKKLNQDYSHYSFKFGHRDRRAKAYSQLQQGSTYTLHFFFVGSHKGRKNRHSILITDKNDRVVAEYSSHKKAYRDINLGYRGRRGELFLILSPYLISKGWEFKRLEIMAWRYPD